jgi:protocatechuate 3,4-dioxygenase beta subunit
MTTEPISSEVADLLADTTVVCREWAEQLEGPYRRGDQPLRRDLMEDRQGVPLRLGLRLADADGAPLTDGEIEVWQCEAVGAEGEVEFVTIYPGWYPGRTVHIHLMAHTAAGTSTTQLYFPEDITDRVLAEEPYCQRTGRDTTNATDTIFSTGGEPAVLELRDVGGGGAGYVAAARLHLP